jgi:hypothetical protein
MSTLSQFAGGNLPPKVLVNAQSAGGGSAGSFIAGIVAGNNGNAKYFASGALTANTLATLLSVTGGGVVELLGAYCADATSRTIRVKIVIDGITAFDATSAAIAAGNQGIMCIGSGGTTIVPSFVPFKSSLLVQVASSLSETDKIFTGIRYWTT